MQISVKTVIKEFVNHWIHIIFISESGHTVLNQIEKEAFYIFNLYLHLCESSFLLLFSWTVDWQVHIWLYFSFCNVYNWL
jgi:hypothetical protein